MMHEGFKRCCGKINKIIEDILVLWFSSKFLLTGESLKQLEIYYCNLEMLLSDHAPSNRESKRHNLKMVKDALILLFVFILASQTTSAIITRLSKALQVLKLGGMETKKKGKTVYVFQAELNSGRLNQSENILSIN